MPKNPRNATTGRGGQRFYSWRSENFWSVTTILSAVPKPALLPWGMKAVATYAVENIDQVSAIARTDPEGAIDLLKRAPYRARDKAADLGTRVHDACEAFRLGKPMPKWTPDVAGRMQCFTQWLEKYKPEFLAVEASVYNRTEQYAGTLDAIVRINGQVLLVDYKTSRTGIYGEVALQLAAYRHAEFIGLPDGSEAPMPESDGAAALWIVDGDLRDECFVGVDTGPQVFSSFLYCREMFRWTQETSKKVLAGPIPAAIADATPEEAAFAIDMKGIS